MRAGEHALEALVSETIGAMPFLWLPIEDDPAPSSQRGHIERNAIALLSNFRDGPLDPATPQWLGHLCSRERVRRSGLWNSNHVDEQYDPEFLQSLEELIGDLERQQ